MWRGRAGSRRGGGWGRRGQLLRPQRPQRRLQALHELDLVVCGHVATVAGPERVGEVGEGGQSVDQLVGHVEELELVCGGGEGGAHDEVHLHGGQHRPQRVKLGPQLSVRSAVLSVQTDRQALTLMAYSSVMYIEVSNWPIVAHIEDQLPELWYILWGLTEFFILLNEVAISVCVCAW